MSASTPLAFPADDKLPPAQPHPASERLWLGFAVWGILALAVAAPRALSGFESPGSVPTIYRNAGVSWIEGRDLYGLSGWDFVYFPQSAALFTPLAALPEVPCAFLWRVLNVAIFAWGVLALTRLAQRRAARVRFLLVSLIAVGLCWSAARHGQMTLAMGGLMFAAAAELDRQRWNRAAIWLVLSVAIKPLSVVMLLLAAALYPRTMLPIVLATVAAVLLPFGMQEPGYVWRQMTLCVQSLQVSVEGGLTATWPQLFAIASAVGLDVPRQAQTVIRLAAALGTLLLCYLAKRRHPSSSAILFTVALAVGYILLFNMRTERNTYALMAPLLGLSFAMARAERHYVRLAFLGALALTMLLSHPLSRRLGEGSEDWLKPLVCLLFVVAVVAWTFPLRGRCQKNAALQPLKDGELTGPHDGAPSGARRRRDPAKQRGSTSPGHNASARGTPSARGR